MTKEIMEQYEAIRKSGVTNMFDYYNVVKIADKLEFYSLASLIREEYGQLLMNFSSLMKKYDISQ
ncbi:DUF5049 domain-containing protein [Patescibacteria group bacterium]|nr:DUF5049 domain-containing protein [Patescibacteria group bacterium]